MIGRLLCLAGLHRWDVYPIGHRHVALCTRPACRGRSNATRWLS